MQNLIEEPSTADLQETMPLDRIKEHQWWQGSLICASDLPDDLKTEGNDADWWVIATQPCNIYNPDFQKIPVFEVVAAVEIPKCDHRLTKGDNPRILHIEVMADAKSKALQIDIQKRKWLPRNLLATLSAPKYHIKDARQDVDANWEKNTWFDNFIGWIARSYTRIALPDDFNLGLRKSKIEDVFKEKLSKRQDKLYGIYLLIASDSDEEWQGHLGEMPAPYLLEIMLVSYEDTDPKLLENELIAHLFENTVNDPDKKDQKITRAELANRHHICIIKQAISAKTMSAVSLLELKRYVRYSFVDHLSGSSLAVDD